MATSTSACTRDALERYLNDQAPEIFQITTQGLDFYGELFARSYPFAKYDQVFVPEYNAGAMENVGASPTTRRTCSATPRRERELTVPRRSSTSWRTCGSATSSRCAGGTTSG